MIGIDNIGDLLLATGLSLLLLCLVFRPLEMLFPARKQKLLRPAWFTDLCFFLGQYLLWTGGVFWVLGYVQLWLDNAVPGTFRQSVAAQPWWLQAVEVIV